MTKQFFAILFAIILCASWIPNYGELFAQTTYYSASATGNWNSAATWRTGSFSGPVAGTAPNMATDNIVIGSGHTITLNTNGIIANLTIIDGTLQYDNVMLRRLEIQGNMRIEANGYFTVRQMGMRRENELFLRGNVVVNGRWEMRPNAGTNNYVVRTIFASPTLQTISGTTMSQVLLFRVSLNKGAKSNVVDCSIPVDISTGNDASVEAFYFNDTGYNSYGTIGGTWRQSANTLSLFQNDGRSQTIELTGAIHIVGSANMLFGQMGGATFRLAGGDLVFNTSSSQPSRFGISTGNSLEYTGINLSTFILQQGTVIVAARFARASATAPIHFEQSGGTLIVGVAGPHTFVDRSTFEVPSDASSFTMSGGTIILKNANATTSVLRPADFWVTNPASISGGTIQFGDAQSSPSQQFNINIPQNTTLNNLTIWNGASLNPYSPTQNLRLQGNMLVNGNFDGTQTHTGTTATAAASTLTLQGANIQSQSISGTGTLTLHNLTMNRQGAGTGVAQLLRTAEVRGVLNLSETPSSIPQILELGGGVDLTLTNTAPNAIQNPAFNVEQNSAETRAIRTGASSGRLFRAMTATGEYVFPLSTLGSSNNPQATYNPLTYYASGASGQLGVKVAVGGNTTLQGAHRQTPMGTLSYARRVWSVLASGNLMGTGRIATFVPSDIAGSAAVMRFSRYRPDETVSGNEWLYTDTLTSRSASEMSGDWTWLESALRIFYSRSSGDWSDATSWSFSSHTGVAVPSGITPSRATDSIIIGGGMNGLNNHVISLKNSVTVGGVQVGINAGATGTLECSGEATLSGQHFILNERSTLRIGSAQGITPVSANTGNIRTTLIRRFPTTAQYDYIGSTEQIFGDGLPSTVYALGVAKPPSVLLRANRSIGISQNLTITSGTLDAGEFTFRNISANAINSGVCTIGAAGMLRIGSTQGFADASTGTVSTFGAYNLDERSTVEFYGLRHVIEPIPANGSYGNISIRAAAEAHIWNPLLLRGSLWVQDAARLVNFSRDLRVFGSVYNNSILLNNGVMDIGQP